MSTYFTEDEAKEKVGKEIKTRYAFAGVPEGSAGKVTGIFEIPFSSVNRFGVYVTWRIPNAPSIPMIDGFSKDEYEQFLEEIEVPVECICKDCLMTAQMCRHKTAGISTIPPVQLLATTLTQIGIEERNDPDRNSEYTLGVTSTITRIRETFGIPEPKGR